MFHVKHFQKRKDDYMSYENFPYSNFHELNADWILEQVRECVKKVADLGLSFEELKEYVNNYFSSLDVDGSIAKEIQLLIDNGTMGALINQTLLGEINAKVDSVSALVSKAYVSGGQILTVGKHGGVMFESISSAVDYAVNNGVSSEKPFTILIEPGLYEEQLVLMNVHGLNFIGTGSIYPNNSVLIRYNGAYPDCVIHAEGDITFKNIRVQNTNGSTYAVHVDPVDRGTTGVVEFRDCRIQGTTAVGYGSGINTQLRLINCQLVGGGDVLYAHNSAYPNRSGQFLFVVGCYFNHTSGKAVMIDDAGYSNGGVSSVMTVIFSGNYTDYAGYLNIQFRKATGVQSTWKSYLPNDDANIRCGTGCANNSGIPGLNVIENHFVQSMVGTSVTDDAGKIYVTATFPPHLNGNNYNIAVTACNVDGIGHNATFLNKGESFYQFTIDGVPRTGVHNWQVNVEFTVA